MLNIKAAIVNWDSEYEVLNQSLPQSKQMRQTVYFDGICNSSLVWCLGRVYVLPNPLDEKRTAP